MARRRQSAGQTLLDAAMRYYMDTPPEPRHLPRYDGTLAWWENLPAEHHQAWDDYETAKKQPTFAAVHRAWVEDDYEDRTTFYMLRDLLLELGLDRQLERGLGFIEAARANHQLPF